MADAVQVGGVWHPNYELGIDRFAQLDLLPCFFHSVQLYHPSLLHVDMRRDSHGFSLLCNKFSHRRCVGLG